jgi:hypothetical protein
VRVEEERQARRELVHIESGIDRGQQWYVASAPREFQNDA